MSPPSIPPRSTSPSHRPSRLRRAFAPAAFLAAVALAPVALRAAHPLADGVPVRGWTILSDSEPDDLKVIAASPGYGINHIELSQKICPRLKELRDDSKRALAARLVDAAHAAGAQEVAVWDDTIYSLDYYPERFRTGPGGTIDLDNPEFWEWFKADYRNLLDLAPRVDALVIQYMESGGVMINQYSRKWTTDAQKLAALVNTIAGIVVGERHMNLYARIYPNDRPDNPHIAEMVDQFSPRVRLLIKETPLDFLLTVPNCGLIGALNRPTLVELVPAPEFAGQGVVSSTWVEDTLQRWRLLSRRPNVIGYTARTDRFLGSRIVGKPGEIDLYAMKRATEEPDVTADQVYDEFITAHYGAAAVSEVKAAFALSFDITTCTYYTLGTILGDHSTLNFEYTPPYIEMCAGRWFDPPITYVRHGVNREFHFWRDIMDHLAPPFVKDPHYRMDTIRSVELAAGAVGLNASNSTNAYYPGDADAAMRRWLHQGENMNEEYLRYVLTEKNYGVGLAEEAVRHIENARAALSPADYEQLHHYFYRTLLTARLWRATTSAYFGFRVWGRGPGHQTPFVRDTVQAGLAEIKEVAALVRDYPVKPPTAMYDWSGEAARAENYFKLIVDDGWPRESQAGIVNPNAGQKFPYAGAR